MISEQKPDAQINQPLELEIHPPILIPEYLIGEVQSKLAYVDEQIANVQVTSDRILLHLKQPSSLTPERRAELEDKVHRVVLTMAKGAFKPKVQVLEDHLDRKVPYKSDPMPELIARGQISKEANGIYTLGELPTRLVDYFESQFINLAESFNAIPNRFPTLIPAQYLERVSYFRSFPHSLSFVSHLREDLDIIDQFSQHATCETHGLNTPLVNFSQVQTLLSPAVCFHLYFSLADKPLPNDRTIVTAVGNCFRYEGINLASLERMWDFTMREVIFVGPKDFVLENRETARLRMAQFFEMIGLAYRVESANDPFFVGEFRKQAAFQSAFQLKFEIRAALPYKGTTLAVGSYNYHQDFFGRSLNITLADGSPAHTGCVAFGLERIAFAFLAQFGIEPANWPAEVREKIG